MEIGFAIESANWRDLKRLHRLESLCFGEDAWPLVDLFTVLVFPRMIRWKAVTTDTMVGFISAELRGATATGWITSLGVIPAFRRQGVGAALLARCEQSIPFACVKLCVRQSNQPAIALYQRAGYSIKDTWPKYYVGGENALVMEKIR